MLPVFFGKGESVDAILIFSLILYNRFVKT